MLRSLYTGISGLLGSQQKLDVVGNNIANASTAGFKRSRVNFQEAFSQTLRHASAPGDAAAGRVPMQVGLGTKVASIDRILEQGGLELTGNFTDLAIHGEGWFIVGDSAGTYYTRNGAFQVNALGGLVTASGQAVHGLNADADGQLAATGEAGAIVLPLDRALPPQATSLVRLGGNLDSALTTSTGSLVAAGNTAGVTSVTGTAANGIGGTWQVEVSGAAATQSRFTGSNPAAPGALDAADTLGSLGVTLFGELSLRVDDGTVLTIGGLDAETTVAEFIARVEATASGVDLSLENGELVLARRRFGDGESYNIQLDETAAESNILARLFGGASLRADNGSDSTLSAVGTLTSNRGVVLAPVALSLGAVDPWTGQVTEITDLGGGGLSVIAAQGLQAGSFSVATEDSVHETSITVYDSLGAAHTLSLSYIRGEEANSWYWEASVPPPGSGLAGNTGTLSFRPEDGSLLAFGYDHGASAFSFDPGNGELLQIQFEAGTPGTLDGLSQAAHTTNALALGQDGRPLGTLDQVDFLDDGRIVGVYSNGHSQALAQVLVAEFSNPQGLAAVGGSLFQTSGASGEARVGTAGGTLGSQIKSGYLEMSNTDLTREFTELIIAQRGFQAAAKVITTGDELLSTTIQLKR
jgi:flagellar hook protein FlgE